MIPSVSFRVVENSTELGHICLIALVYLGSRYTGLKLCKRLDDNLYFLMERKYSDWNSIYYTFVDKSGTTDKSIALQIIKNKIGA